MKKHKFFIAACLCACFCGCSSMPAPVPEATDGAFETRQTEASSETEAETASDDTAAAKTDFTQVHTVTDPEMFMACLAEARDNLVNTVQLKIPDYNDTDYDIHNFERGKYSLASEGKIIGDTAYMTYTFDYSDSYAVSRACADPSLLDRLSEQQQHTVKPLEAIRDLVITDGMSDYEKELALHDYITKNCSYDTEAAARDKIDSEATNITPFIVNKKGVCEAYAFTFKALCDLSGLECHIVTGTMDGTSHAWNVIKLDGEYYNVDVTADDPVPDTPQHSCYTYFNLPDADICRSHVPSSHDYICTADKYNYFIYNGLVADSYDSLKALIDSHISRGETTILFRTKGYILTSDDLGKMLSYKGFTSYALMGDPADPYGSYELQLNK